MTHRVNDSSDLPAAVFFDFDGVLVDSEPLHFQSMVDVLAPLGLAFDRAEYDAVYIGFDDREVFETAFRAGGRALSRVERDRLLEEKGRAFLRHVQEHPPAPLPGVMSLIRDLRRQGIPLALCSGALPSDIDPILARIGLDDAFMLRVTAADVARSKPDPESYRLAHRRLADALAPASLPLERCLAIEDTPAGIASARAAGLRVLAVASTCTSHALADADGVVPALDKLAPSDLSVYLK